MVDYFHLEVIDHAFLFGGFMRKILRQIARNNMRQAGIRRINREGFIYDISIAEYGYWMPQKSYFSMFWRDYVK